MCLSDFQNEGYLWPFAPGALKKHLGRLWTVNPSSPMAASEQLEHFAVECIHIRRIRGYTNIWTGTSGSIQGTTLYKQPELKTAALELLRASPESFLIGWKSSMDLKPSDVKDTPICQPELKAKLLDAMTGWFVIYSALL